VIFLIFVIFARGGHYGYSFRAPKYVATPLVKTVLRSEWTETHSSIFALRSFRRAAIRSSPNYESSSPTPSATWAARDEAASGTAVI